MGIGCRFPGRVDSPDALWRLLADEVDAIETLPPGRFDTRRFAGPPGTPGTIATTEGGYLHDIDRFDAAFFGISPREAAKIDPQHRLLLELAWEAMEDGGVVPSSLAGPRTGVYVGVWTGEYENVLYRSPERLDFHAVTGGGRYSASGRLSWAFDLRGPCVTVDSGCSSSLAAVHMAAQAIATGEIDTAVVGAANLILQPHVNIAYSRSGMLSPGGRCRFGDAGASGYVRSDGAAVLVLKSGERARRDGDRIRARILATGVNADGRSSGQLATPSASAQRELLETVYGRAGIDPGDLAYVEAHGTGTRAGDPVEMQALGEVLGRGRPADRPLLVGSVKSNIGHTEACAGLAGLIKAVLAVERGWIPASLHCTEPNPAIPWSRLGVAVARTATPWPDDAPRVAGVSSFGITGTNAHAVVAAADAPPRPGVQSGGGSGADGRPAPWADGPWPVLLSARSESALRRAAAALADRVEGGRVALPDLGYTTTVRRQHLPHRAAAVVDSADEVCRLLRAIADGRAEGGVSLGVAPEEEPPRVAFVFSGQGSQWVGMGRRLMEVAPAFAAVVDDAESVLAGMVDWSLRAVLAGEHPMATIDVIQPVLAVVQIGLARQLEAWGVHPSAVLGHSMGEVPAAHVAGALDLADALAVLVARSRLLAGIAGRGAMALVDEEPDRVERRLARLDGRVSVAAVNGPRSTVVSGDPEGVDRLLAELEKEDVFCRRVRVDVASHSAQTEPLLGPLAEALAGLSPRSSRIPFHSTVEAAIVPGERLDASYWTANLRQPVRLQHTVRALVDQGVEVFVEIAPHPVLASSLADIAADAGRRPAIVPLLRRDDPEPLRILEGLTRLHVAGVEPAWSRLAAPGADLVDLPSYPWDRVSHWIEDWEDWSGRPDAAGGAARRPRDADDAVYEVVWEAMDPADPEKALRIRGGWVVVGGGAELGGAVADALRARGGEVRHLPADASPERIVDAPGAPVAGIVDLRALAAVASDDDPLLPAVERSCHGALALARHLIARELRPDAGVWWPTRGAQDRPVPAAVPQAALWGLVRTLWEEHPDLPAHLVDLDPASDTAGAVDQLVDAIVHRSAEAQLTFRDGAARRARLRRAPATATATAARWNPDTTWLVTGGLGDLGLVAAEEMVRDGATRLVLMGRRGLPPRERWDAPDADPDTARRIAAVRRIESLGAQVRVVPADVADRDALAGALASVEKGGWPPVGGVVHCAGILRNQLVRDLSWTEFAAVLRAKAEGAWNLHALLPGLERMVLFSSVVPVLPQAGQANYAAANAVLDALAAARRGAGSPAISLGWGVWSDAGLVRDARVSRSVDEMAVQGLRGFSRSEGGALFRWTAASDRAHLVVAAVDWAGAAPRLSGRRDAAFFEALGKEGAAPGAPGEGGPRLAEELAGMAGPARRERLAEGVRTLASGVLGIAPDSLPLERPLGNCGLDSLMAMELRNRLEQSLGLRLPATIVWSHPTVSALATHLDGRLPTDAPPPGVGPEGPDSSPPAPGPQAPTPGGVLPSDVAEASDEDILRMLREGS